MKEKTPIDIILVSLFLFWTSFAYFDVNKSIFPVYGFLIHGGIANVLWILTSIIYIVCAFGFYKKYFIIWKFLIGYSIFQLGNFLMNNFFISHERMIFIMTNTILTDYKPPDSNFYFYLLLLFQVVFIVYLFKRKRIFMKNRINNEDNQE
jgi:hypothetical protein